MYIQRQRAILEEVYKIYHSIYPAYVNELLERVQHMYATGNKCTIVQIKMQNDKIWYKLFYVHVWRCQIWNELRQDFKLLPSIKDFKGAMASFNGRTCGCSFCVLCVLITSNLTVYVHLTPHLHCTHPFTGIFHYNSACFIFIVGQ